MLKRSAPKPKEADVLRQVKHLLTIHQAKGSLIWRRLNTGAKLRSIRGRVIFTANTEMVGLPDLLIWVKGGPVMCWELKAPGGKQSVGQKEFESQLISVGHDYFVVRCLEDAILILKGCGL